MKTLIIKPEIAEKLRSIEFPKGNVLNPQKGFINGVEVEWLQASLKEVDLFKDVLRDFETCEVKEIETIEEKYFDSKDVEIFPTKKQIESLELTTKTILTQKK
jgi:hypothetical protein